MRGFNNKKENENVIRHSPFFGKEGAKPFFQSSQLKGSDNNIQSKEENTESINNENVSTSTPEKIMQNLGKGSPMPSNTKGEMESAFGASFSNVKFHSDSNAKKTAQSMNAEAFTVGNHIVFNNDDYSNGKITSKALIAHELAHVQQQHGKRNAEKSADPELENNANDVASLVITGKQGNQKSKVKSSKGLSIQRCGGKSEKEKDAGVPNELEKYRQLSPEQVREELRKLPPKSLNTPENLKYLQLLYPDTNSDDYFMASRIIMYGNEMDWPPAELAERARRSDKGNWNETAQVTLLGESAGKRPINSYFFPGKTDKRALIISGVHGSELSGVEVVETLINQLQTGPRPFYSVILVPRLFPDNIATAEANPKKIETEENVGRYTSGTRYTKSHSIEPQRQMPTMGTGFDEKKPVDSLGRPVEPENVMLLKLIQQFRPSRIASIHSSHHLKNAGIYADPRTDAKQKALGFDSDRNLALKMAKVAQDKKAKVPGNKLDNTEVKDDNAIYPKDKPFVPPGETQPRDLGESKTKAEEKGTSLGGWGSTAVCDPTKPATNRPAMRIITVELHGAKRISDYEAGEQAARKAEIEGHTAALREIFLGEHNVETAEDPCALAPAPATPVPKPAPKPTPTPKKKTTH